MKFSTSPPALIFQGDHPHVSKQRSFVVILAKSANAATLAHELWHVKQFWAKLLLGAVLWALFLYFGPTMPQDWLWPSLAVLLMLLNILTEIIPSWDYSSETAAYAESNRHGRSLESCAKALSGNPKLYGGSITFAEAIADISDKVGRNRLGWFPLF